MHMVFSRSYKIIHMVLQDMCREAELVRHPVCC